MCCINGAVPVNQLIIASNQSQTQKNFYLYLHLADYFIRAIHESKRHC